MDIKWNYVSKDGNPKKSGVYFVVLTYDEYRKGRRTGNKVAWIGTRCYDNLDTHPELLNWTMQGEPEHGLAWTEESGSSIGEKVLAWADMEDFQNNIELPDGVKWEVWEDYYEQAEEE